MCNLGGIKKGKVTQATLPSRRTNSLVPLVVSEFGNILSSRTWSTQTEEQIMKTVSDVWYISSFEWLYGRSSRNGFSAYRQNWKLYTARMQVQKEKRAHVEERRTPIGSTIEPVRKRRIGAKKQRLDVELSGILDGLDSVMARERVQRASTGKKRRLWSSRRNTERRWTVCAQKQAERRYQLRASS